MGKAKRTNTDYALMNDMHYFVRDKTIESFFGLKN